jgi:phosphoesterase RecJ-like protein
MGYVLYEKMRLHTREKTSVIALTQEELNRFRYRSGDTEGFVNLPLSIDGICFSGFLREETSLIKISLRSVGDFPCNRFAAAYFNGGGHKNASGGEFYGTLEEAVKVFEDGLMQFNPNNFEKT